MAYTKIPCDYPYLKKFSIKNEFMHYLDRNADKERITISLINNEKYEKRNLDFLAKLNSSGLSQWQHYRIMEIPEYLDSEHNESSFSLENLPLLYIPPNNQWRIRSTTLFGIQGVNLFKDYLEGEANTFRKLSNSAVMPK